MKKVFIVGGDGFARDCFNNLVNLTEYGKEVIFAGFLGHNGYGTSVNYKSNQHLYIGEVMEHDFKDDEYCIIGAGYPNTRKQIYYDLKKYGAKFYTLVCNGIDLSESFNFGEANIFVSPFLSSVDIEIGVGNVFNGQNGVGHDVKIGDFNFFGPMSHVLGYASVGNNNLFAIGSTLLPHSVVGSNNKIAPFSVIYKSCKNNCYMMGNPAIKIGDIDE